MVFHLIPILLFKYAVGHSVAAGAAGMAAGAFGAAAIANGVRSKNYSTNSNSSSNEKGFYESLASIIQSHYADLENYDWDGSVKTSLDDVATCSFGSCGCNDYDDRYQGNAKPNNAGSWCTCGHSLDSHMGKDITWLVKRLAADTYERLGHQDSDESYKTRLEQIDKCDKCGCNDYDHSDDETLVSERCTCSHKWTNHTRVGGSEYGWLLVELVKRHNDGFAYGY